MNSRRGVPIGAELVLLLPFLALGMAALVPAGFMLAKLTELPWWLPALALPLTSPLALTRPVELLLARFGKGHRRPDTKERQVIESSIARVERKCARTPKSWVVVVEASQALNAFTSGRHTIGITTTALGLPSDHLDAVVAHELAHQYNGDTWATAIRAWVTSPLRWLVRISQFAGWVFAGLSVVSGAAVIPALLFASVVWFASVPVICLTPLLAWVQRRNELAADAHAARNGYGAELAALLLVVDQPKAASRWQRWCSTHPDTDLRLQALGCA